MKTVIISLLVGLSLSLSVVASANEHVVVPYAVGGEYWTGLAFTSMLGDNFCVTELDEYQATVKNQNIPVGCNGQPYQKTIILQPQTRIVHIQGRNHFCVTRVIGDTAIRSIETFHSE